MYVVTRCTQPCYLFCFQVQHSIYPYKPDTKSIQDKILLEAEYYAHKLSLDALRQLNCEEEEMDNGDRAEVGGVKEDIDDELADGQFHDEAEDGQFDDAEDDDDILHNIRKAFNDSDFTTFVDDFARTRICEDDSGNRLLEVPISRLMEFNGLQKICSSTDLLR